MVGMFRDRVTVYRSTPWGVSRRVLPHANLQIMDKLVEDSHSPEWERPFLLIVPGEADIRIGDRVILGEGPEPPESWADFIPENVEGLCQVQFVQHQHLFGICSHTEAGRKASTFLY